MMPSPLYTADLAERLKAHAGEKYRPSNGTEGEMFIERWCDGCEKDKAYRGGTGDSCPIVANSLCFDVDDENYPTEWQYDEDGQPKCTAYEPEQPQ